MNLLFALDDPVSNCSIPYSDIKPLIAKYILKRWQDSWDQQIHNKLQEMHSLVGKTPCSYDSFKTCKIVSPATFVNKLDKLLAL
jgi:hypothetical protein